jgi:Amt family ammonium transporter
MILWAMHYIPGLSLRVPEETEVAGIDNSDMDEYAYDYVGLQPEL